MTPTVRRVHRRRRARGGDRLGLPRAHGHDVTVAADARRRRRRRPTPTWSSPARRRRWPPASPTRCAAAGVPCFGPTAALARLESSKGFARALAAAARPARRRRSSRTDVAPTRRWRGGTSSARPVVVKLDGLAAGKGVIVPADAGEPPRRRSSTLAGRGPIVLEERLHRAGVLADGVVRRPHRPRPLPLAQDHKRIGEGDTGPNTGGMGAYAPAPVPYVGRRAAAPRSSSRCSTTSPPPARRTSACSTPG